MLGVLGAAAACGSSSSPEKVEASGSVGSLGLQLRAASGATLSSFNYVITGPGGFSRPGTVGIDGSSKLSTLIGGLPVGSGFVVSLTAVATDDSLSCTGSASFDIAPRATSSVVVRLQCPRRLARAAC